MKLWDVHRGDGFCGLISASLKLFQVIEVVSMIEVYPKELPRMGQL